MQKHFAVIADLELAVENIDGMWFLRVSKRLKDRREASFL